MNAAELGHVIKEARIAKKMTQSQVVGNFITWNMLSQIENGNALPSLPTLEYLAEVLDLPDILDFSSSSSNESSRELSHISDVAAAITAGLANGHTTLAAVKTAKAFVHQAIMAGSPFNTYLGHIWHGAYRDNGNRLT